MISYFSGHRQNFFADDVRIFFFSVNAVVVSSYAQVTAVGREVSQNYTKVFLKEEKLIGHEKISTLEALLDPAEFIRVHKSFIVAVTKIKSIEGNRIRIGDHLVPIGQTYRRQVRKLLDR